VVVKSGKKIAEGYHRRAGTDHGERVAISKAGTKARGATLYVNLEPCHHHGRTPPCSELVLAAGIKRVVYGQRDPMAGHGGGGAFLSRHGVRVERGVLGKECEDANRFFSSVAKKGRPYFILKAGMSLDGKVATRTGESQWITSAAARADGHGFRNALDAILVGVGTVFADDPRLSARGKGARDPIRVVLDATLRTPPVARLLPGTKGPRTILVATSSASAGRERRLVARGAEVWRVGRGQKVGLPGLAKRLAREGVNSVLVEGGPTVHASFLDAGLADELLLYVAPLTIGGGGLGWIGGKGVGALATAEEFAHAEAPVSFGRDLRLRLQARRPKTKVEGSSARTKKRG